MKEMRRLKLGLGWDNELSIGDHGKTAILTVRAPGEEGGVVSECYELTKDEAGKLAEWLTVWAHN